MADSGERQFEKLSTIPNHAGSIRRACSSQAQSNKSRFGLALRPTMRLWNRADCQLLKHLYSTQNARNRGSECDGQVSTIEKHRSSRPPFFGSFSDSFFIITLGAGCSGVRTALCGSVPIGCSARRPTRKYVGDADTAPRSRRELRTRFESNVCLHDALHSSVFINVPEELYTVMLLRFSLDT